MNPNERPIGRRDALKVTGVSAAALLAGCTGGGSTPTPEQDLPSFGGWMESVGNYDGVHDQTGKSKVTVRVGVEANGGPYGFGPAAVKVSTGTTVEWRWTGDGRHDVVAKDGSFQSDTHSEAGATFTHTFESAGTYKYYCTPHRAMGMRGVVVVE